MERDTHLALLHERQALLPGVLILYSELHHAVCMVGVCLHGQKQNTSAALPEGRGERERGAPPFLREAYSPRENALNQDYRAHPDYPWLPRLCQARAWWSQMSPQNLGFPSHPSHLSQEGLATRSCVYMELSDKRLTDR